MKKVINGLLSRFGYALTRIPVANPTSLDAALTRVSVRHPKIGTVIDVGASDGRWTKEVQKFYPRAAYFLVEANPVHETHLKDLQRTDPRVNYVLAAAGDREGQIYFDASDPFGGVASQEPVEGYQSLPVTSVDHQVATRNLQPPYLLKLDTHGFEVPILRGAAKTLKQTEIAIIEAYNFQIEPNSLKFYEMCAYMAELGFSPVDLVDPLHRGYDQAFWQLDLIFVPSTSKEFSHSKYDL